MGCGTSLLLLMCSRQVITRCPLCRSPCRARQRAHSRGAHLCVRRMRLGTLTKGVGLRGPQGPRPGPERGQPSAASAREARR